MQKKIVIGITDTESAYHNYPNWIKGEDAFIEIIQLRPDNFEAINQCSGIVLSGGVDTHPRFYNNPRTNYPNAPQALNEARDEFEISVFQHTQTVGLPLLAICRGMQLANICLGGTLVQDLEEHRKMNHRKQDGLDSLHEIAIISGTLMQDLAQKMPQTINSAHHQGLDHVAPELLVSAWSPDGVPEAVERKETAGKSFFLGVQWHPERLLHRVPDGRFTQNIRLCFLEAALKN